MGLLAFLRTKAAGILQPVTAAASSAWGWIVRESFTGAWQRNITVNRDSVLAYWAVYACISLIAGDIAKLRLKLVEENADGVWTEIRRGSPYLKLLRKPNHYQTRLQFFTYWFTCLLVHGNVYALKRRDERGMVNGLYILDPSGVTVLVGEDGSVFYRLRKDNLDGRGELIDVTVPASEIIHDRMICLHHPLIGVSPIFACGVAATQGLAIQNNSANFFTNGSMPGGIIKVPGSLPPDKAAALKLAWETNYSGENRGKTAVLADKMEYEPMSVSAEDSQLIEQLKMTAEMVCSTFKVPGYKVGVGTAPAGNSIVNLDLGYYSQCLQPIIEGTEAVLDDGLGLSEAEGRTPGSFGTEFDLEDLTRMDPGAQVEYHSKAVKGALETPNEARRKMGLPPMKGGDSLYLQQQNYSLDALAKRDAQENPFGTAPAPTPTPAPDEPDDEPEIDPEAIAAEAGKAAAEAVTRALVDITARVNSIAAAVANPPAPIDPLGGVEVRAFLDELEQAFPDG